MRYRCSKCGAEFDMDATGPSLTVRCRGEEGVVATRVTSLRQDLLAAVGDPLPVEGLGLVGKLEGELSWRRGWNAKRESMLEAINRLLPEEA